MNRMNVMNRMNIMNRMVIIVIMITAKGSPRGQTPPIRGRWHEVPEGERSRAAGEGWLL